MIESLAASLRNHLVAIIADRAAARERAGARGPAPIEVPEGASLAPDLVAHLEAFNQAVAALAEATGQHARDWSCLADLFTTGSTLATIRGRAAALRSEHCELLRRELDLLDQERTLLRQLAESAPAIPKDIADDMRARARDIHTRGMPLVAQELVEVFHSAIAGTALPATVR